MNFIRNFIKGRRGISQIRWRKETSLESEIEDKDNDSNENEIEFCRKSNYPKNSCEAQWMLLYSCITSMEDHPSEASLKSAKDFIRNIPDQCKFTQIEDTFSEGIKDFDNAISTANSKRELLLLLCTIENKCRHKLGKPLVSCNYSEIMKRWYKKD
ncbi:hypothetical protein CPHLJ_8g1435 [Cryptosporidium parvum]|uniref:Sulfhydryl oxidase n=1 Tax=Cryptosporidium parvum TaxID=5807 RepID=A0A7S7RE83_CRYPV|nr:ERV/ALR sulfhydryl oxidase domain containing protein [Cryptosporidium parvum]WKS79393.1 hypothetical protein CPCDC_8g1435 [Cryptosporidium sp. 43IA8]WRK33892.1 ERV/ALR sulfhydryl oxidase domain containing protein [Cryptosporidium parvum]|eukprot:QOY39895.1 hypothetical protein CPATCC_003950 [Cryptosporidium parvum]